MPSSSARSAALHAYEARPGASTTEAFGLTTAVAPTSPTEDPTDHHRLHPRRSSPAPLTTANETGVTQAAAATSNSTARSAARHAFRAKPGVSTNVAYGWIKAVAPNSAYAKQVNPREPLPTKWLP